MRKEISDSFENVMSNTRFSSEFWLRKNNGIWENDMIDTRKMHDTKQTIRELFVSEVEHLFYRWIKWFYFLRKTHN